MQREMELLRASLGAGGGAGGKSRELDHVTLTLRGKDLAAMDINLFSKNSSDPYFTLHVTHADGSLHRVGKSETVPKCLSPQWLGVEVPFEKLRGATQLKVEVRATYYGPTYYGPPYFGPTYYGPLTREPPYIYIYIYEGACHPDHTQIIYICSQPDRARARHAQE